ncbi:MAG: hypothetical protein PHQ00_06705, partial [Phycisphaerae bacterium]|nr:hypothetical protein [Phycisphaerae bacterium]
ILNSRWQSVRGFSWWNETWENDDDAEHNTDMRVQSIPGMSEVFKRHLSSGKVLGSLNLE